MLSLALTIYGARSKPCLSLHDAIEIRFIINRLKIEPEVPCLDNAELPSTHAATDVADGTELTNNAVCTSSLPTSTNVLHTEGVPMSCRLRPAYLSKVSLCSHQETVIDTFSTACSINQDCFNIIYIQACFVCVFFVYE